MKYNNSDFHFYTVAHGERFIEAAKRSAESFERYNPGIKFTIFVLDDTENLELNPRGSRFNIVRVFDYGVMDKKYLEINKYYDILFFKFCIAPEYLKEGKYIGFVDADTLCQCELPLSRLIEPLDNMNICVAPDPMDEVRCEELFNNVHVEWFSEFKYFNSGVVFWNRSMNDLFCDKFNSWVKSNMDMLSKCKFGDQTWLNLFLNGREHLYMLGWYWNFRGCIHHPRAYIWHAGGRDSEGIESIRKFLDRD